MTEKMSEEKAINILTKIILGIIGVIIFILAVSFIYGKYNKYNALINGYETELTDQYSFNNIETLQFLDTENLIEYQKLVKEIIEGDEIEDVSEIVVLDTIVKNSDSGIYEWFISLNDKDMSTYKNTYTASGINSDEIGAFTISKYEVDENSDFNDEENTIKEEAIQDGMNYIEGSIDNIASVLPTVENIGKLGEYIADEDGVEFSNKFRTFLVETGNNRRTFILSQSSIENKANEVVFVLKPEIKLAKENTIRVVFDKKERTFIFEYTD